MNSTTRILTRCDILGEPGRGRRAIQICAAAAAVLACAGPMPSVGADRSFTPEETAALREILGSNPLTWRFNHRQFTIEKIDGRNALCSGENKTTILLGTEQFRHAPLLNRFVEGGILKTDGKGLKPAAVGITDQPRNDGRIQAATEIGPNGYIRTQS